MKKHRLSKAMFYLAGPIENDDTLGLSWRIDMTRFLNKRGIAVLCPINKPIGQPEDESFQDYCNILRETKDYNQLHEEGKKIVSLDYRMVDKADATILYIDKDIHMCGSYHENCMATIQRKPIIVCCKQGKQAVPLWIFGVGKHEMFFSSWKEVKEYIDYLITALDPPTFNRWQFFDYEKVYANLFEVFKNENNSDVPL